MDPNLLLRGDHAIPLQSLSSWTDVPTDLLHKELQRRQEAGNTSKPECGSKSKSQYNTSIHVFALFLILALSAASCAFPIAVRRFPSFPVPHRFLFLSRHFGTGVLIATAFVHLFPTAYTSLTDPCLPDFWNHRYPAMPGLVAMTSVFVVVAIEMFFATRGAGHVHGSEYDSLGKEIAYRHSRNNSTNEGRNARSVELQTAGLGKGPGHLQQAQTLSTSTDNLMAGRSPSVSNAPSLPAASINTRRTDDIIVQDDEDDGRSELSFDLQELQQDGGDTQNLLRWNGESSHNQAGAQGAPFNDEDLGAMSHRRTRSDGTPQMTEAEHSRALLQCLLLEAGILFHSIFIGMALSVSTGPPFAVLLVAISFHQTFEGLALGSRISALNFAPGSPQPWLMALAYGTTTPVGQAIGLALHRLYDPASETGLLVVGLTNAVSSGLLLFAGLVELLAEDFLSEASYKTLRGRSRLEACGSVVAGAMLMALVGAWA